MTATRAIPAAAIHLQPFALFAKLDGAADYAWQMGRHQLPPECAPLLETIGQHAATTQAQIVLLFRDVAMEGHWLARTYTRLLDAAGRLSPAVEVLRIVEPGTLNPELCLRLVSDVLTWQTLEHAQEFTCEPPAIERDPRPLDPGDALRARLGLRLSLAPLQALGLVRQAGPWRYRGICYARLSSGACVPWLEGLHPFLCINFDAPSPTPEEQAILRAVREHEPSDAEWEVLDRLPVAEVRRALSWLAEGSPVPAPVRNGDPLAPWVLAWLQRRVVPGPALLDALVASAGGEALDPESARAAAPGISAEAVRALLTAGTDEVPALSRSMAEELAQGGYLGSDTGGRLSLESWVPQAAGSATVAEAAIERLERAGMPRAAACFLLDLPPAEDAGGDLPDPAAAQKCSLLGLPVPRQRIAAALEHVASPAQMERLAAVAEAFPGWGEAFGRCLLGREGSVQTLDTEVLVGILAARQRVLADASSWRAVLAGLIRHHETEAARKFLAALQSRHGLAPPAELEAVLRARLGQAPAAPAPLPSILEPLARDGLARPEDIVLPDVDGGHIPDWARLWPATVPLARLLEGAGTGPLPEVPASWRQAVRRSLAPSRLIRWIQTSRDLPRETLVAWAAEVLELPRHRLQALLDGAADRRAPETAEAAERARDWLAALLIDLPRAEALRALAGQGRLELFAADESGAAELVQALLPDDGEAAHELATYALCRVGPIPQLDGVPPDVALAVVERLNPLDVVDASFRMTGVELTADARWLQAVAGLIERSGTVCPQGGYLKRQVKRHPALAERLSQIAGWEQLTPGIPIRVRLALGFLRLLNLRAEDLVKERPARTSAEIPAASAPRRRS